ncbi:MAG: hypothetical protein ACR2NV_06095 [Thermoleophilaceae bacterium]
MLSNRQGELSPLEVGTLVAALESDQELVTFSEGGLLGYFAALHEVAQAQEEAWAPLVERLIAEKWRVSDAKNRARTAGEVVDAIPTGHRSWLDPAVTVGRWLATGEPTPRAVAQRYYTVGPLVADLENA